jgi:4a-hydroxytetrahydrobiopterin dehydratase
MTGDSSVTRMTQIPDGWTRDGEVISRTVERKDFKEALAFVNAVGDEAEKANHHPDIDIRWNKVTLALSTHSEGKLTDKDTDLASKINALI